MDSGHCSPERSLFQRGAFIQPLSVDAKQWSQLIVNPRDGHPPVVGSHLPGETQDTGPVLTGGRVRQPPGWQMLQRSRDVLKRSTIYARWCALYPLSLTYASFQVK